MLTRIEKGILAGLTEVVYMPMELISNQKALHDLIAKGLVHQLEGTTTVTLTFKGVEYMGKANANNIRDRRNQIAGSG